MFISGVKIQHPISIISKLTCTQHISDPSLQVALEVTVFVTHKCGKSTTIWRTFIKCHKLKTMHISLHQSKNCKRQKKISAHLDFTFISVQYNNTNNTFDCLRNYHFVQLDGWNWFWYTCVQQTVFTNASIHTTVECMELIFGLFSWTIVSWVAFNTEVIIVDNAKANILRRTFGFLSAQHILQI